MILEPKLIANFQSGLNQYYKPWLAPEDAFQELSNAYIWRGSVLKREGMTSLTSAANPLAPGPVMGLQQRIDPDNGDPSLVAFNTTKAFEYDPSSDAFNDISGSTVWTGSQSDFFWADNSFDGFFVTNGFDPIRYYNATDGNWYDLLPVTSGTTTLDTALIVVSHKQRLIALNTFEDGIRYSQRARWSQISNPYATGTPPTTYSLSADAWRDDIAGRGGFVDAPTSEDIVSIAFNKDNLIVFFENSTWRLRYTGNAFAPFDWEQVNSQLGSQATFGTVTFDEFALSVSKRGFIAAATNQVRRIDDKIPDVANLLNSSHGGLQRIHAAREFYRELAIWTYGDQDTANNDRILCYNYQNQAWSKFNLPLSCLGNGAYTDGITWDEADFTWDSSEASSQTWEGSSVVQGLQSIIGGDINGGVYHLFEGTDDNGSDINFDIKTKRFIPYAELGQKARLHYVDFYMTGAVGGEFTVEHYIDTIPTPIATKAVPYATASDVRYVRCYLGAVGRTHQLRFFLSPSQLAGAAGEAKWELQGMVLWFSRAGRINDP